MSGDWVNRLGIILNFCAGFLLAPELIKIQRLQRFEKFLEENLPRFRNSIEETLQKNRVTVRGRFGILALVLGSLALWWIFILAMVIFFELPARWVPLAIAVSLGVGAIVAILVSMRASNALERTLRKIGDIFFTILLLPIAILWGLGLVSVGSWLLSRVLGIVIARLTGNDRLRGIVVSLGIALFIMGNSLQLLATWLPDSQK
jgi:hypothetical protein